uniref:Uncharacterized protein n=1 Tax=Oryza sativa subsp. japonica TaxID=39947 RepID=Q6Z8M3_ORYSJ|nr:hypothetical protein [Oryza sativa Japonica Group]
MAGHGRREREENSRSSAMGKETGPLRLYIGEERRWLEAVSERRKRRRARRRLGGEEELDAGSNSDWSIMSVWCSGWRQRCEVAADVSG